MGKAPPPGKSAVNEPPSRLERHVRTKNIATVSAVMFGLTAALMGGTALGQMTAQDPAARQPIPEQGQTGTQAQDQTGTQTQGDTTAPDTGVAEDADPTTSDTGVAEDADPLQSETGTGMAADDGMPRRSVTDTAEPCTGDVLAGVTAEGLIGMDVVDTTGESVGPVTDLLLGDNNQVDHAIIDVGGFLGFGAKSVAIPLDELMIAEGEVVLDTTRDQLDLMPEWSRGDEGWMSN